MKVIYLKNFDEVVEIENLSLVLGNFDGVHIGHSQLIKYAQQNCGGKVGVFTFDKPIKSEKEYLTSIDDKIKLFEELGVDFVFIAVVDDNFKNMFYTDFVDYVLKKINPIKIFCGPDFKYGAQALGDVTYLKRRFHEVYVLNYVLSHEGEKISSSCIRRLIKNGDIYEANRWLGRFYSIKGKVVKGLGNGKRLGFPTANCDLNFSYVVPKKGVYVSKVVIEGKTFTALTNIGNNPTISDSLSLTIESYILDFQDDIYGKDIEIYFYKYLREDKKFNSERELVEQMGKDLDDTLYYFSYVKKLL